MNIDTTTQSPTEIIADAIVLGIWADEPLAGAAAHVNDAMGGTIDRLLETKNVSSKRLSVATLLAPAHVTSPVILLVGLGKRQSADESLAFQAAAAAAKALAATPRARVAFFLDLTPMTATVCGSIVGCVGQDMYRKERKIHPIDTILWAANDASAVAEGRILADSMNLTRRLVNQPASEIYPESFATQCRRIAAESGFECEVWDEHRLEQENCRALLAVGQGSHRAPRLVIMRYCNGPSGQKPFGLIGKGVTFDSGGLSLKPSDMMIDMKMDMAGAATVLGAVQAIAQLKLPVNVTGFACLAENMVSGNCLKLGDILTARSGKTIEVRNTDAEGRLVLSDTIDVALETGVEKLIDVATLTGACMAALGKNTVGLMTNHEAWSQCVLAAARSAGEPVWQLPMFEEFGEQIKSDVADIKNVGDGRWGGAMTAAKFLEEFVRETPWVHLDIAGPAFAEKPKPWIDAGASGCMVRTLVEVARRTATP